MGWMKHVSMIIDDAEDAGVRLTLGDFSRDGDTLLIRGVPESEFFASAEYLVARQLAGETDCCQASASVLTLCGQPRRIGTFYCEDHQR